MALALAPLINTDGVQFGTPPAAGWAPTSIRYYKLSISTGTGTQLRFNYPLSGYVDWVDDQQFQNLISAARTDDVKYLQKVLRPLTSTEERAPDIIVTRPCYVIYQLDQSWNWHLLPGVPSMRSENDCRTKYRGLLHYPDQLISNPVTAPLGSPHGAPVDACHVLTFAVTSVADKSTGMMDDCDLYVQFSGTTDHFIPVFVDPDIKNNGGDPD